MTEINHQTGELTGKVKLVEPLADFARWAAVQLGLEVSDDDGTPRIHLPEDARHRFGGQETIALADAPAAISDGADLDTSRAAALRAATLDWLCVALRSKGAVVHARPRGEPDAVSALVPPLFAAFQIDGGQIHLGGCRLEDRPFLRFTFGLASDVPFKAVRHVFVAADGSRVSDEQVAALGLDDLQPIGEFPPRIDDTEVAAMLAAGRQLAARQQRAADPAANVDHPLAAALVWSKYAIGQLQFTAGDQAVLLPFEGWARTLAPPPYVCPLTGICSFHLAATDDGRITAADAIAACARSGRRVLAQELVRCHVTGLSVLSEFVETCPVSGQPVLHEEFAECPTCRQRVSRVVLTERGCGGCDNPPPAPADDPRLVWILAEHAGLGQWKRWRLGETGTAYIVHAEGFLQSLLVVLDRTTLVIRHMARRSRLARRWAPLAADRWQQYAR